MLALAGRHHLLAAGPPRLLHIDDVNQVLIFERGGLVFIFNFHVEGSVADYQLPVPQAGRYRVLLNSDRSEFGGFNRLDDSLLYDTLGGGGTATAPQLRLYLTTRTALVLGAAEA